MWVCVCVWGGGGKERLDKRTFENSKKPHFPSEVRILIFLIMPRENQVVMILKSTKNRGQQKMRVVVLKL